MIYFFPTHSVSYKINNTCNSPDNVLEFHVSRSSRDRYQFDLSMFSISGNVIFANFHAARLFAQKINDQRDLINYPEQAVSAAEINAMGLIHEILHNMMMQYRTEQKSSVFDEALEWLGNRFGDTEIEQMLTRFLDEFPPLPVYRNEINLETYLNGMTDVRANRQIALEEMLLLWVTNAHPAFSKYKELFDDATLREAPPYLQAMSQLEVFFEDQPLFGPKGGGMNLFQLLLSPAKSNPHSLLDQLHYMRDKWQDFLKGGIEIRWEILLSDEFIDQWGAPPQGYETRVLRNIDFITEETKVRFNPGLGPAPTHVPEFWGEDEEIEQFSMDLHWLPQLVLMAKSTLVWLDQLGKTYQTEVNRLDQIPDEELDKLASWGFTGLWLIGIWERSAASRDIKHLCGNPDAASSAYSLFDYQIAENLGGEPAYENLRDRLWKRGMRLGSDMVPNHTGVDSKWIHEHPDWFIQSPYPPFPAYTFNGKDLSTNPDVGIFLEDHYYDRTDASVVFKRIDKRSGETRYIYHGNDGTSMPWNDTAQLNYLNPEVREAAIQTILSVAKKFPVIRFDAAMTLAKKHFHRLWYPEPGSGGDIPSRAEHGLTRAQFNALIPQEFWREVVDRVAEEAPETLLLAEAFWMMEGYFVRTLGMHRVYNSAFMHMLMKEENKKYRYTIKNTLEFDPEILKRYVNFMSNPDEETAIDQFGDGDKYFGICMMMCTMPGLPMFGHGQVEGFKEKYGMEYQRAYYDETPNSYLIERHQREIFPIIKKRYLFAEVENFLLYDFYQPDGRVNENVFAYTNRAGDERSLVVFNNSYEPTSGWIRTSAAYLDKAGSKSLVQKTLGEGLSLGNNNHQFCILRDHVKGLETIHRSRELLERGLYVELKGYGYHVYYDIRERLDDETGQCARLANYLDGRGVPDIEEALRELNLQPLHHSYRVLGDSDRLKRLIESAQENSAEDDLYEDLLEQYRSFGNVLAKHKQFEGEHNNLQKRVKQLLGLMPMLNGKELATAYPLPSSRKYKAALKTLDEILRDDAIKATLYSWIFVHALGLLDDTQTEETFHQKSRSWIDELLLFKVIRNELVQFSHQNDMAGESVQIIKLLTAHHNWYQQDKKEAHSILSGLFKDSDFQHFLSVNRYEEKLWFNKEAFAKITGWLYLHGIIEILREKPTSLKGAKAKSLAKDIIKLHDLTILWKKAEEKSEYQVKLLLEELDKKPAKRPTTQKQAPAKSTKKAASTEKKRKTDVSKPTAKKAKTVKATVKKDTSNKEKE